MTLPKSNVFHIVALLFLQTLFQGGQQQAMLDSYASIGDRGWSYEITPGFDLQVEDTSAVYSLALNLRHTGDYKYSNLFLLIHVIGPGQDTTTNRFEFLLAAPDGRWLGDGSGNLYSYRIPFSDSTHFSKAGMYHFMPEQKSRDQVITSIE